MPFGVHLRNPINKQAEWRINWNNPSFYNMLDYITFFVITKPSREPIGIILHFLHYIF